MMKPRYWLQSALASDSAPAPPAVDWLAVGRGVGSFVAVPSSPFELERPDSGAGLVAPGLRPACPGCPPAPEKVPASAMPPTITATAAAPASAFGCQRPRLRGRRCA